jgi:hypothetical protein
VRNFQIWLESEGGGEFERDELNLHIVPEPGPSESELEALIASRLREGVELTPDHVVFEYDEASFERRLFQKSSVKAEYVVERRAGRQ